MSGGLQEFYREEVNRLLRVGVLDSKMSVLVLCGGRTDRTVLLESGFEHVTISNVDSRPEPAEFAPYEWSYQDVERLTFPDDSFDFCIVHSGLHHCHSPHRALLEMYRVARRGLLLFEPYDNVLTRLGVRLNIGQEYEHAAVYLNGCEYGGVGNGPIPNFIYRWTEREIIKTINSYAPHVRHDIRFVHKLRLPWTQLRRRRNKSFYYAVRLALPVLKLMDVCFPKQGNGFAALVLKPELPQALHPWVREEDGDVRLNPEWITNRYRG